MPKQMQDVCTLFSCDRYRGESKCCFYCNCREDCADRKGPCLNNPHKCGYYKDVPFKTDHIDHQTYQDDLIHDYDDDYYAAKSKEAWD